MSLEQEIRSLTQAVNELRLCIKSEGIKPAVVESEPPKPEPPKEDSKAAVKAAASEVMEKCGKDKLNWLLNCFGVKKISELKAGGNVYQDFIDRASELIPNEDEEAQPDLLDESPATAPVANIEDVKLILNKVINHPELGRNFVSGILSGLGAARLGDLEARKYITAIEMATAELKKVGA